MLPSVVPDDTDDVTGTEPIMTRISRRARNEKTDLLSRTSGGVDVTLYWNRRTAQVTVELADRRRGTVRVFVVPPDRARYVFDHPFAYAHEQRSGRVAA
jgi:hypothetical protein